LVYTKLQVHLFTQVIREAVGTLQRPMNI
jgi:hypothetical protein